MLTVLRQRRFRIVLGGEALSMLGDSAFEVALAWLVLQETGSVAALAGVMLAQAVPGGLLLLFGGAVTDRLSPAAVMFASHVVRAVVIAAIAVLASTDDFAMWQLYCLAAVIGAAGAFFGPAADSVLPQLLPADQLARGNALQGTAEQVSLVVGPIVGGALTAWQGASSAITVNAATFVIAAMTVRAAPRARPDALPEPLFRQIGEGLRFVRESHEVRIVLLLVGAGALSYSGLFAVGLPVLARSLSSSPVALGVLISAWGVGQLTGTLSAAITGLPRRWGLLIIGMTLAEATAFALLGVSGSIVVAATILAVLGFGVAYSSDVALPTFVQTRTPNHLLGRISSVIGLPRVVFGPVSIVLLGAVLHWSIGWGFAAAAVPVLLVGVRMLLDPRSRQLSSGPVQ